MVSALFFPLGVPLLLILRNVVQMWMIWVCFGFFPHPPFFGANLWAAWNAPDITNLLTPVGWFSYNDGFILAMKKFASKVRMSLLVLPHFDLKCIIEVILIPAYGSQEAIYSFGPNKLVKQICPLWHMAIWVWIMEASRNECSSLAGWRRDYYFGLRRSRIIWKFVPVLRKCLRTFGWLRRILVFLQYSHMMS